MEKHVNRRIFLLNKYKYNKYFHEIVAFYLINYKYCMHFIT